MGLNRVGVFRGSWGNWGQVGQVGPSRTSGARGAEVKLVLHVPSASHWRRCDFNLSLMPRLEILVACADPVYDRAALADRLAPLRQKAQACEKCVDSTFTRPWLHKLQAENAMKAYFTLHNALAIVPVNGTAVERKHPLGQEVRATRRRGRAPNAKTMGLRVYRKVALLHLRRKLRHAVREALGIGDDELAPEAKRFMQHALSLAPGNRADRRCTRPRPITRGAPTRASGTTTGYQCFRRAHWNSAVRPKTLEFRAEQARIGELWRALPPGRRAAYCTEAAAENQDATDGQPGHAGQWARRGAQKRKALDALQRVRKARAWDSGAMLEAFGTGLKPELVDVSGTNAECVLQADAIFGYDPVPANNDKGQLMHAEQVCAQLHGGLCCAHKDLDATRAVLYHLYRLCMRCKIKREMLPLHLRLRLLFETSVRKDVLLSLQFGKGDFYGVFGVVGHEAPSDGPVVYRLERDVDGTNVVPLSLHMLIASLLATVVPAAEGAAPAFQAQIFSLKDGGLGEFAYTVAELLADGILSTKQRGLAAKRQTVANDVEDLADDLPFGFRAPAEEVEDSVRSHGRYAIVRNEKSFAR